MARRLPDGPVPPKIEMFDFDFDFDRSSSSSSTAQRSTAQHSTHNGRQTATSSSNAWPARAH
eukprot:2418697-Heterocapsa_arctica.AAC.1